MRIGIGYYKADRAIKDALNKEKDRLAFDIFDFLTDHAEYEAASITVQKIVFELEAGQLITSLKKIIDHLQSWGIKAASTAIRNKLEKLVALGAIECEDLKKGSKSIGTKITVNHLRNTYTALEPQGIEQNDNTYNDKNNTYNNTKNNTYTALEPQGLQQNDNTYNNTQNVTPFFKELKELKEKDLKEKDLKEAAKIPESQSIVNTAAQVYDNFFKKISKRITEIQRDSIDEIIDSGMQAELIIAVMDKAGMNSTQSAPAYIINTCRELIKDNILTLDKYMQNAAQYKKTQGNRQQNKVLSTRRGLAVPDGYADNLPF